MDSVHAMHAGTSGLRARFANNESLLSTFVKTVSPHTVEVLGHSGLDVLVLDAEHAPFDRHALDMGCLAARAAGIPVMVRVAGSEPAQILQALDLGAEGVLVPHIDSPELAQAAVQAGRYREDAGQRGFSNSPRAGRYGLSTLTSHVSQSDRDTALVMQIESRRAVDAIAEIVTVPGIDGLFVGRADLAVSYGCDALTDPVIQACVETICEHARARCIPLGIFLPDAAEVPRFHDMGFRFFVLGSDQSLLRSAAASAAQAARAGMV